MKKIMRGKKGEGEWGGGGRKKDKKTNNLKPQKNWVKKGEKRKKKYPHNVFFSSVHQKIMNQW